LLKQDLEIEKLI
jgi:hypothetical protein